jgi:hypothetical protein
MALQIIEIVSFICALSTIPLGFAFVLMLGITIFHIWFGFEGTYK